MVIRRNNFCLWQIWGHQCVWRCWVTDCSGYKLFMLLAQSKVNSVDSAVLFWGEGRNEWKFTVDNFDRINTNYFNAHLWSMFRFGVKRVIASVFSQIFAGDKDHRKWERCLNEYNSLLLSCASSVQRVCLVVSLGIVGEKRMSYNGSFFPWVHDRARFSWWDACGHLNWGSLGGRLKKALKLN